MAVKSIPYMCYICRYPRHRLLRPVPGQYEVSMPVQGLGTTIFDFAVSGAPGSTYQGRRHAAEALNGEAAKRPSKMRS